MKKLIYMFTIMPLCVTMILYAVFPITAYAIVDSLAPKPGDEKVVEIAWTRTTEPTGAKVLPVASWTWSDVKDINYSKTTDVWDGGTIGDFYIKDARRPWDIATWHTNRHYWNGYADVRRFHGQFTIPKGYTASDDVMLSSVGDYRTLGLEDIIAINDNIYIFVYPKGEVLDDDNFMDYFAFWTGTASQEAAKAFNNGKPITFHGIEGTTPYDYKENIGQSIPPENLLSHTDGWYCDATENNVGYIMKNSPDSTEFVIDLFVEDFAEDGGMDRLDLTFIKLAQGAGGEEMFPPLTLPKEEMTEGAILSKSTESGLTGAAHDIFKSPKTDDTSNMILLWVIIGMLVCGAFYFYRKANTSAK